MNKELYTSCATKDGSLFFYAKKEEKELIKSLITGREYSEKNCVYVTNMLQAQKYLANLGPQYLLDILYTGTYRRDSLVFVFERCPETRRAKEL